MVDLGLRSAGFEAAGRGEEMEERFDKVLRFVIEENRYTLDVLEFNDDT